MKNMKKVLAVVMAAAMLLVCFASCGSDSDNSAKKGYTANNTEFIIGVSGPLTGAAAFYGTSAVNSAQLAVDEINAAGGLNGVKFKLVSMDDMHDPTKVAGNYATLLEGGMQVSLGCITSAPGAEWTELSKKDNVFTITPSASNDDIPKYENGYQMCFADGRQGEAAASYVNDNFKGQTIGIFYKSDDNYSQGIFEQFKGKLDSSIKSIDAAFTEANTADFSSQIALLKDCKFIFMPIYYTPASLFMTQAKDIIAADATYYGCDGFDGIDAIEGFDINSIPQQVSMLSHFDSNSTEGAAKEFIDKYVAKFKKDTLSQFGASAYDCIYALYNAMKDANVTDVTISASELCEVLKAKFQGGFTLKNAVTGNGKDVSWDSNGYVNKSAIKFIIKDASK